MPFEKVSVFVYDLSTGAFIKEADALTTIEREHSLRRGTVYDALTGSGRIVKAGIIVSRSKFDVFPLETLPKNFAGIKKEVIPVVTGQPCATTLTEEQLRQKHDMFFMVSSYVNKIPVGKFIEEGQLLRELGLYGKPRYRDAITRPELKENKGKVDGTIYYGHQESIRKLKNEGVLQ